MPKIEQVVDDEALLKQVLEQSMNEVQMQQPNIMFTADQSQMSIAVRTAVDNGFSAQQGIEAESMIMATMGDAAAQNADIVLQFLISNYGMNF